MWLGIFMSGVSAHAPTYELFQETWKQTFRPLYNGPHQWSDEGHCIDGRNVCLYSGRNVCYQPIKWFQEIWKLYIHRLVRKLIHRTLYLNCRASLPCRPYTMKVIWDWIWNPPHCGFSASKGTVTALLDKTHRWFEVLENGEDVCTILFDYCM